MLTQLLLLGLVLPVFCVPQVSGANYLVAAAWYAGWHAKDFPLSKVSWSKYTHMTYAFAETTANVKAFNISASDQEMLQQFSSMARKNGVKSLISIGGWTGSRFFSDNVATAQNRTVFVKSVVDLVAKYNLDGIDFDWEYPANQGIGWNTITANDTANFLAFLQELRKDIRGKTLILSAAVATTPFIDSNGKPSSDVSGFGKVLDFIAIMVYDIWGSWSPTVGPNSPLDDTCAIPARREGSAVSAVKQWNAAGIPLKQLVLGVASYGHSFRVRKADAFKSGSSTTLASYPPFNATNQPAGDSWDDSSGVDAHGTPLPAGGNIDFWGLIEQGYLNSDGTPKHGIAYTFDSCSKTPYVYNPKTEVMVSFDDTRSYSAKGAFIKSKGLRGFAMWEAGGDSNDILLDSVRRSGGF
ncbi:chitinase [Collybia nuda]|uniref:Chitinase n=1 Tax=Collybia nuda TaxID=64659 RepID=A0A9P6CJX2_9AGAR|nr:chitinase [Collybia nuda]